MNMVNQNFKLKHVKKLSLFAEKVRTNGAWGYKICGLALIHSERLLYRIEFSPVSGPFLSPVVEPVIQNN